MGSSEFILAVFVGAVLLIAPLATLVMSIIAYVRSRRIEDLMNRVVELERRVLESQNALLITPDVPKVAEREPFKRGSGSAAIPARDIPAVPPGDRASTSSNAALWETFIGQKAFGWIAVLLFVLAAAFFLRYAYQNNWIGPVGRVSISELVGLGLVASGWWYMRHGLPLFSNMLTAAGIVVMYLATYSAFGFYELLPQQRAGFFLGVLVFESMVLAVCYRSLIIALVSVIGGLLTPLLMASDIDSYQALFLYLALLNAGVVAVTSIRGWSVVSWVAYLGTQGLFALWYDSSYHPEKFLWTLGFQAVLFGLYLLQSLSISVFHRRSLSQPELVLFIANAVVSFLIFRLLLQDQHANWLGILSLVMATLYAVVANWVLSHSSRNTRFSMASMAVTVGLIASAIPLQANARWVSLAWTAMGATLWWFGLRVSMPLFRTLAGILAIASISRLLMMDLPFSIRDPFIPILNREALPSIGVAICILGSVLIADPYLKRLSQPEQNLIAAAGVVGVLLVWIVVSIDCYGYFLSQSIGDDPLNIEVWRWRGQLALTVFWAVFATTLLVLGFQFDRARLRWFAIVIYGTAVVKLFVVDMANVQQLYRILVFFVLAIVLGLVARTYQRFPKKATL